MNVTNPRTEFYGIYLDGRVDPASGEVPLSKPRIEKIANELGNRVTVTYGHGGGCTASTIPSEPAANYKECFPRWWTPPGQASKKSWFHKYVVKKTASENLPTGGVLTSSASRIRGIRR